MELDRVIAVRNTKTIYRNLGDCLKVFNSASAEEVLREAMHQAAAEDLGLPVPSFEKVTQVHGKWAIVSQYIPGNTVAKLLQEAPENTEALLKSFVGLQLKIHERTVPGPGNLKPYIQSKLLLSGLDQAVTEDLLHRLDSMPTDSHLCHGDFNPSNVIAGPDEKLYVIDWKHSAYGAAPADAAATYVNLCLYHSRELAEQYLSIYCERSGEEASSVLSWVPLAAASRLYKANRSDRSILLPLIQL